MKSDDKKFMRLAIAEMKKSLPEDPRVHPRVGVVVTKGSRVLATAFRGETGPGEHAEFVALERKLGTQSIVGATVFTTLEPCTTRKHPKVPCAERLRERGVKRVLIGMLDPNKKISGAGQRGLSQANIETELFSQELSKEVMAENREFVRLHSESTEDGPTRVNYQAKNPKARLPVKRGRRNWSTLVVATDAHYKMATELVNSAEREIVLCQRTTTLLLAPEKGRPNEQAFHNALQNRIREGIQMFHLIHEESCMADIWRMPGKFRLELGTVPSAPNICVGRYIGEKPVPRLLIVDQKVLGSVFDIDQTQFYSVVESPEVRQASEHTRRYINDRGQDGFDVERFYRRLRKVRDTAQKILQDFDPADRNVFAQFVASELKKAKCPAPVIDLAFSGSSKTVIAHIPLAWPKKQLAVFLDSPMVPREEIERERIGAQLNTAVQHGWRCLFLSRAESLVGLDQLIPKIRTFVRSGGV